MELSNNKLKHYKAIIPDHFSHVLTQKIFLFNIFCARTCETWTSL